MVFGAAETNKGLEHGWAEQGDAEQSLQRLERNLQQLEASLLWQFGFDDRESVGLDFAHHGGVVLNAVNAWLVIAAGTVALIDDQANYVERDAISGAVTTNLAGFTDGPGSVPMYQVETAGGEIVDVLDRRPFVGTAAGEGAAPGGGGGGGGGCLTFSCLLGAILASQVPQAAVTQHQAALVIAFTQLTGQATLAQLPDENEALYRFVADGHL